MSFNIYLLCIVGMGLVTYIPRWLPLIWLTGRDVSPLLVRWLKFVPASILSALVLPAILTDPHTHAISLSRPEFLVALPTLAFGWWSRSLGGTVIVGMLLFFLVGKIL
ncbi:MAG: AzlD domain-containing protein [Syntrophaceae bacterium]